MLVAVIAALAAALIASLVAYDRLARRSAAVIAEAQAAAHEAQAIARQAIDKLAEKNIELDRAKRLMQLQNRAQADIERIFLGFVRQASPTPWRESSPASTHSWACIAPWRLTGSGSLRKEEPPVDKWTDAEFIVWVLDRRIPVTARTIRSRFGCSAATSYRWNAWVPWIRGEQAGDVVKKNPGRAQYLLNLREQLLWAQGQAEPITGIAVRVQFDKTRATACRLAHVLENARSSFQVKQGLQPRRAPSQSGARH